MRRPLHRTTLGLGGRIGRAITFSGTDDFPSFQNWTIEDAAHVAGIAVRSGCFCSPGNSERAFGFADGPVMDCLASLGDAFTIPNFAECMGGAAVGAVNVSLGCGSVRADVDRLLSFVNGLG